MSLTVGNAALRLDLDSKGAVNALWWPPRAEEPSVVQHRFEFVGSAGEYFKIWLANICLTIITLGIYGPWAKVRREKYFHSNTLLDGSGFEYRGNPISILKGRLIVLCIFVSLMVTQQFYPKAHLWVIGATFLLAPWLITQALRFRARYTVYRNIPFRFSGTVFWSFINLFLVRVGAIFSAGLIFPWAKYVERKYLVNNLGMGRTMFEHRNSLGKFYRVYLVVAGMLAPGLIVITLRELYMASMKTGQVLSPQAEMYAHLFVGKGAAICAFAALALGILSSSFYLRVMLAKLTWNNAWIGAFKVSYQLSFWRYAWIVISNFMLRLLTLGFAGPYTEVRMLRYKLSQLSLSGPAHLEGFCGAAQTDYRAFGDEASDIFGLDLDVGL